MKTPKLSKGMQAAVWAASVLTVVALLKTPPLESNLRLEAASDPNGLQTAASVQADLDWLRAAPAEWKSAEPDQAPPRAPTEAAPVVAAPAPVAEPPKPAVPDPGLTYLGRIEQDGRRYVFLGGDAGPQVVEIGALIDRQWRVQKVTGAHVELRYLPLDETRLIAVQ